MPENDGLLLIFGIGLAIGAAGFIQSLIGFGFAISSLAILPYFLDARESHLIVSISGIPVLVLAAYVYRQRAMIAPLGWALFGSLVTLPLGIFVFSQLPLHWLVRGTGAAVLLFAMLELTGRQPERRETVSRGHCWTAGAISGFLSGAVSIGGPPIVAFAIRQKWSPADYRFFVTFFLLIQAMLKGAGLFGGGLMTPRTISLSLQAMPAALLGVVIGAAVARRIDARHYRHLVAVALIVSGASLLFSQGPSSEDDIVSQAAHATEQLQSAISLPVE